MYTVASHRKVRTVLAKALLVLSIVTGLAGSRSAFAADEREPSFGHASWYLTGIGGYHTASGDTETAPPPLGLYGATFGYESSLSHGSGWTYGGELVFLSSTANPDSGFAYLGFSSRFAYYATPLEDRSWMFWVGLGGGLAGYNVNTAGLGIQGGVSYMLSRYLGLGIFANATTLLAAEGIRIGTTAINDFDGATTANLGGSLIIRFPL